MTARGTTVKAEAKGTRRIAEALNLVAQARVSPSSQQIFECLTMPRSSGYDLLGALARRQFLQKRDGGRWVLGDEIHALALSRFGLGRLAAKIPIVLTALQEETQEIAQLVVLNSSATLVTHAFGSLRSMRIATDVGTVLPVNWTAAGRLLAPEMPDRELGNFFAANARSSAAGTAIMASELLVRDAREARARGYAIEKEQAHQGFSSIAAPLIDRQSAHIAAVVLVLPISRLDNSQDSLVSLVCASAMRLSHALTSGSV